MYALVVAIALGNSPGGAVPAYTFTVEGFLPTRLNVLLRAHWAKRLRLLRGDADRVGWAFKLAGIPPAEGKRRVSVCYLSPRPPRDPDAGWKILLDGLKACGAILDDAPAYCDLGPVRHQRGPRATVIELEDLP